MILNHTGNARPRGGNKYMRITVLIENSACPNEKLGLVAEHGLSLYVESEGRRLVVDSGASDAVWSNAAKLGIDAATARGLAISHGHYDHTGGALRFASLNPQAPIWMRRTALGEFWHVEPGNDHYIGLDRALTSVPSLRLLDGDAELMPGVRAFTNVSARRPRPRGNAELMVRTPDGALTPDTFDHEQCLVVEESGRRILISGCAHNGILNILDRYRELFGGAPDVVVSGFHMKRKDGYTAEDESEIAATGEELLATGAAFYTGHCTGDLPCAILKDVMGDRLTRLHTGLVVEL